ncbi:hypothetical protein [Novosphingobium cyanobacteriorum]|uniref:Lipoprotein n=1 Tax=Novosphingobium cyanobacteriorum TaxID=3024215 RepID=A0ABT6CNG0_9SPHN|nr:hypothetical protein [Novosphingobium cyanobacteriorum]MDF8335059.1 hypothetical protein [Novosphingobium cyanobacteriorum]
MNRLSIIAAASASLLIAGCATVPPPVRSDGFAMLHEATRVGPLTVRPEAVREDSRCPMNARCIWAGRVVIDASVKEGDRWIPRSLVLGEPALTTDGEVMLDSVEPPTRTDTPIRAQDYRFHFSWKGR